MSQKNNNHTHHHNPIETQQQMANSLQMMLMALNEVENQEEKLEIARLAYGAKEPMAEVYYIGELLNAITAAKEDNNTNLVVQYGRELSLAARKEAVDDTVKMIAEEISSEEIAQEYIKIAEEAKALGKENDFSVKVAEKYRELKE